MNSDHSYTAFAGEKLLHSGNLEDTLAKVKQRLDQGENAKLLIFDDQNGRQVDFDLRGSLREVLDRLSAHPHVAAGAPVSRGPGRPRLGVVSREISLLPRHWQWLEAQPRAISATVRRLVEGAAQEPGAGSAAARDAAGKFMWAMAGDYPGFEEASRALYAGDRQRFAALIAKWPRDIQQHLLKLTRAC